MPQGGSITAGSMIPIIWFALRRGTRAGLEAGTVYGLVKLALPGAEFYHPLQVLLDYPLAFGSLGLAGIFKKHPIIGVGVGMFSRFFIHFISGVVYYAAYAPEGMHPVIYSILYNGSYMLPEFIITAILMYLLVKKKTLEIYL
jgi:thiamine transporter